MRVCRKSSGGHSAVLVCQGERCGFQVVLKQSRAAFNRGQWFICSSTQHAFFCKPVLSPGLPLQAVINLPCIASSSHSAERPCHRLQQDRVFREHGIRLSMSSLCRAAQHVKGLALASAQKQLLSLGKLLQAFVEKNPGSLVVAEKDKDNNLTRLFIRPGAHSSSMPALLGIAHNDAFHLKTVIFSSNLAATVMLTNQRTSFIYSIGMFPIENQEHWTWYMQKLDDDALGARLHEGSGMIMGDREKGEEAAASTIFSETCKASCLYHIRKNMEAHHIRARADNRHIWYNVGTAATISERDDWLEMLKKCEPLQYAYLSQLNSVTWQNAEQLLLGIRTHCTRTNNVAEGVGNILCKEELSELPIRYRAPYAMIEGILQLFCDRATRLREQAAKLEADDIEYSDYALSVFHREDIESESYACVKVGVNEWVVRRVGIITDKVRHVQADCEFHLKCECLLDQECGIACRHMLCVAKSDKRFNQILVNPCDQLWRNAIFIDTFRTFEVLMPSATEIFVCPGDLFPGPFLVPKKVKQRGRPRVKRFKSAGEQFKRKMRKRTAEGGLDKRRQCSLCRAVGHFKKECPVRQRFKLSQ